MKTTGNDKMHFSINFTKMFELYREIKVGFAAGDYEGKI